MIVDALTWMEISGDLLNIQLVDELLDKTDSFAR